MKGDIITDYTAIKRIIREYDEQLYAYKFNNLGEMDNYLETQTTDLTEE